MELMEIVRDALVYPFNNIKALLIYLVLGIILGIVVIGSFSAAVVSFQADNALAFIGSGILGIIFALLIGFVISGYELDIVKYGIQRDDDAPNVDFVRQFINGVKLFIVNIVYMIVPIIIGAILAVIFQHWLSSLIMIVLSIIFALALLMAICRLAKTEDLSNALSIREAIEDISRVGYLNVIIFIIVIFGISFILNFIVAIISQWNSTIGSILFGILGIYITFFMARATGLLYSDV